MARPARYAASVLAPSTESGSAVLCVQCGVLVADTAAHDRFHVRMSARSRRPEPGGETRDQA